MYDFLISCVQITFALSIFPQLIKNFQKKKTDIHSYLWHILTEMGFLVLMYCFYNMDLMLSFCTIIFNFSTRAVLISQMVYYGWLNKNVKI